MRSTTHDLEAALRRVVPPLAFAVLPIVFVITMFVIGLDPGPLSHDFHYELYPEAEVLLDGRNPFPGSDFDPLSPEPNLVWPPLAAILVSPLTLLPLAAADVAMAAIGLVCFGYALWLVGVRDWRVYGAFCLWPQVVGEMRVSHLTPQIALLLALAWRTRNQELSTGAAVGFAIAIKLFVWPLVVWLAARRSLRAAALASIAGLGTLVLVQPFTELTTYLDVLEQIRRTFDQDSYTAYGLLVQLDAPEVVAHAATLTLAVVLISATWWTRSFTLAVATAFAISPIVWLDYFALAGIPLAIARPRLNAAWLLPIATWGAAGSGIGIGDPFENARVLAVFAIVVAVAFRCERDAESRRCRTATGVERPVRVPA